MASTVKQLAELLNQVKDEQSYIVVRERTYRNTVESINGRVKRWSVLQPGVLIGEGMYKSEWWKRCFEVRVPRCRQTRGGATRLEIRD